MHHWELLGSCLVYRAQPGGAVFNPRQVRGHCAPAFSSLSTLHADPCYCRENLEKGEHSISSCTGPRSRQEVHQRSGTKPERHTGVRPCLGCGWCSGPEDRSLSLKAALETPQGFSLPCPHSTPIPDLGYAHPHQSCPWIQAGKP